MESRSSIKEALGAIQALGRRGAWEEALRRLDEAKTSVVLCNACASSCSKVKWPLALVLMDKARAQGLELTSVTLNCGLQALVHAQKSPTTSWPLSLVLLRSQLGVQRDTVSWNSASDAMSKANAERWTLATELMSCMATRAVEQDSFSASVAARSLGNWPDALRICRDASSIITYSSGISACDWQQQLQLLSLAPTRRLRLDDQARGAALRPGPSDASESEEFNLGQWRSVLQLLREIRHSDLIALSSAVAALTQLRRWQVALDLFESRAGAGTSHDEVLLGAGIAACAAGGLWELALSLLHEGSRAPNLIMYNAAISACEEGLAWEHALALLEAMPKAQLLPDIVALSSTISALGQGQRWSDGLALLWQLQRSMPLNVVSLTAAISVCEKSGRWTLALQLLDMCGDLRLEPNTQSFNSAISACEKGSAWPKALELLEDMGHRSLVPSAVSFCAASSACARAGAWEQSASLLRHEAGFAGVAACVASCDWAGPPAVPKMPWLLGLVDQEAQSSPSQAAPSQVLAVELLHLHGFLPASRLSALRRRLAPLLRRLPLAAAPLGAEAAEAAEWRTRDPQLERESFLGTILTAQFCNLSPGSSWVPRARAGARRKEAADEAEPSAKAIVAWAGASVGDLRSSGRVYEWSWQWGIGPLVPVFVEHDRSPHAERQALLSLLYSLQT